jgi:hypothetical protein
LKINGTVYVKSNAKSGENCDAYGVDPRRMKIYLMRSSTMMIPN